MAVTLEQSAASAAAFAYVGPLTNRSVYNNASNYSAYTNASIASFQLLGSSYGTFNSKPVLTIESRTMHIDWTSDSSISCPLFGAFSQDLSFLRLVFSNVSDNLVTRIANPFFVPSPKPMDEILNCVMYIPAPVAVVNQFQSYAKTGPVEGQKFTLQNDLKFLFSEVMNIDIVVFSNHSQFYLLGKSPAEISIAGDVYFVDQQTGNSITPSVLCFGHTNVSAVLPSESFAVMFRVAVALCPQSDVTARIRFNFIAQDSSKKPFPFTTESSPFTIKGPPNASVAIHKFPLSNATPASTTMPPLEIALNSSLDYCSRNIALSADVSLACASPFTAPALPRPFYSDGLSGNVPAQFNAKLQITSCGASVVLSFCQVGRCALSVVVPALKLQLMSEAFVVVNGAPSNFEVIGDLSTELRGGSLLWSTNTSGRNCLGCRVFDGCNNTCSIGGFPMKLSATLVSNHTLYNLLGDVYSATDSNGTVFWCDARVSLAASMLVQVFVSFGDSFQKPLPALFNISGVGEPAKLSAPASLTSNASVSVAAGALLPITFKMQDAAGSPTSQPNAAVRVRIVKKTYTRYTHVPHATSLSCLLNPHPCLPVLAAC